MTDQSQSAHSPLFVGPKGEHAENFSTLWNHLLETTMARRAVRFSDDPLWQPGDSAYGQQNSITVEAALAELLALLKEEIPTFSPPFHFSYFRSNSAFNYLILV